MSVVTAAAWAPSWAASSTAISSRIATATWTIAKHRHDDDRQRHGEFHRSLPVVAAAPAPACRVRPTSESDPLDRAVDHLVEQAGDAFGPAPGGRPGDHEQADERRGEQDERILRRGLTVVAEPAGCGCAPRRTASIDSVAATCRRMNMVSSASAMGGPPLGWSSVGASRPSVAGTGGGSLERPSAGQASDQRSRLSDESAAINAGAIREEDERGERADHEWERQPDGEPSCVGLVEAPPCRPHVERERLQHRPDRHAVPIGAGDQIGERPPPATQAFRQRLHGLGRTVRRDRVGGRPRRIRCAPRPAR